jgi:adenylate cyclase
MNQETNDNMWRMMLTGNFEAMKNFRAVFKHLPAEPRCPICYSPFSGVGGSISRVFFKKEPSSLNPRFCNDCDRFAREMPGGAEVEITMLFADVRGSTALAEGLSPSEFTRLLNRFYAAATNILVPADSWIDKLVGDEIIALFIPGFAGAHHPHVAVHAAQNLLKAVGYGKPDGAWLPIGVGVHTDTVYVGSVGSGGITDITALGDGMNTTARLVSSAAAGEIVISEATARAANLDTAGLESRTLELKGKAEPFAVRVLTFNTPVHEGTPVG